MIQTITTFSKINFHKITKDFDDVHSLRADDDYQKDDDESSHKELRLVMDVLIILEQANVIRQWVQELMKVFIINIKFPYCTFVTLF